MPTPEQYLTALRRARTVTDRQAILTALEARLVPATWAPWLRRYFPDQTSAPFAPFHQDFWDWVWSVEAETPTRSQVLPWGRGLAKSMSAELAVAAFAARRTRRYALYVCAKQHQADDHVTNIAGLLESPRFGDAYPAVQHRQVGLYGQPRAWRRQRLRTASGFTVDAAGLDVAIRGVRIDADRPDLIILDDVDELDDTPTTTTKKINAITKSIIGAGAGAHLAVIFCQNVVHSDSTMAQLLDGRAAFLRGAHRTEPIPAFRGLTVEDTGHGWRVTAGTPTWEGFGIDAAERMMADMSLAAFRAEYLHEVELLGGGLFDHLAFRHCTPDQVPDLVEVAVWVDPAVTTTDQSDACAIQVDGWGADGKLYRLRSYEQRTTPTLVLRQALLWAYQYGAQAVGVETDQGRDTWASVWREAMAALLTERPDLADLPQPGFVERQAGVTQQSKAARASQMVPPYEHGRVVHVTGDHELLERALVRFPLRKPWDLVDAAYWGWRYLWERYAEGTTTETEADAYSTQLPG